MNRDLESLQSRTLARCRTSAGEPVTGRELAAVMSCDPSEVTRFRQGERAMDTMEWAALVRRYGAVAALSALAELDGALVVTTTPAPLPLQAGAVGMVGDAAGILASVHAKLADGILTATEGADLDAELANLVKRAEGMRAAIRSRR